MQLSRSEPWDAPEWSHVDFSFPAAKKMDIYSYGLLCLWLFFGDATLAGWELPSATVHAVFSGQDSTAFAEFQWRKKTGNDIMHLALALTGQHTSFTSETKSRLRDLFTLTLDIDAGRRSGDIESLLQILCKEDVSLSVLMLNVLYGLC